MCITFCPVTYRHHGCRTFCGERYYSVAAKLQIFLLPALTHRCYPRLIDWLIALSLDCSIDWLIALSLDRSIDWLLACFIAWLIRLIDWLYYRVFTNFIEFFSCFLSFFLNLFIFFIGHLGLNFCMEFFDFFKFSIFLWNFFCFSLTLFIKKTLIFFLSLFPSLFFFAGHRWRRVVDDVRVGHEVPQSGGSWRPLHGQFNRTDCLFRLHHPGPKGAPLRQLEVVSP